MTELSARKLAGLNPKEEEEVEEGLDWWPETKKYGGIVAFVLKNLSVEVNMAEAEERLCLLYHTNISKTTTTTNNIMSFLLSLHFSLD